MGLDMYLSKRTYVKNWDHHPEEKKNTFEIKQGGKVREDIDPTKISYIIEEVAYWRKANAIHQYFVDNCQDGNDDCGEHYVEEDKLKELLNRCKVVKASLERSGKRTIQVKNGYANGQPTYCAVEVFTETATAEDLLPIQTGFFFGSEHYDEWYLKDLDYTIEVIENLFKDVKEGGYLSGEIYYQSSW